MRIYGLVGKTLDHSRSEEYFRQKFNNEQITDAVYRNFAVKHINELPDLIINNPGIAGLNVTNPYKVEVLSYLDEISPEAGIIGAVNCIKITREKEKKILKGFNTDHPAFRETLKPLLHDRHRKALVLGTGGAAKAICLALNELKIDFKVVSRAKNNGDLSYEQLNAKILTDHLIIINATPSGLYPDINSAPPIPYECLTPDHLLYDLIYNPEETLFLKHGRKAGAKIKNGLEMLHLQAELSWSIWA